MTASSWLAFMTVAAATAFAPGPAVALALGNAIRVGPRRALVGSMGNATGVLLVGWACLWIVGRVLEAAPIAFAALRVTGAAYLMYLGLRLWRSAGSATLRCQPEADAVSTAGRVFRQGLWVALTNPKSVVFFGAVLPAFAGTDGPAANGPLLVSCFAGLTAFAHAVYVLGLSAITSRFDGARVATFVQQGAGAVLLGMGSSLLIV